MAKKRFDQSMVADLSASAARFNMRMIERVSKRKKRRR